MKRVGLFFLYLFLLIHTATAQSVITIDVNENGNAVWTMEEYLPLANQDEIDEWVEYIQSGESIEQYQYDIEEFRGRIEWLIILAELSSDRSMNAENFNLSHDTLNTLSGSFGIVRFSFEWINFSRTESDKFFIGDVFSEGMILSYDNVLIINIPIGYEVESVSPDFDERDGNRLIWDGTLARSFDKGEPALVLSREKTDTGIWVLALVMVILAATASVVLFKLKKSFISSTKNDVDPILSPIATEVLEDEEMIEQILIRSGGQMHQSEIVKLSGLSKSKISIVLSEMKEDGKIIKIKKGKGNIIRLVNDNQT
ncbi:MAG: hypothetical protein HF976_12225 [ANME-2 cluster archaeon]|nr:hypothetical protein [ANME-2 cluster archaeon]MBC2702148.1 hypothetical protein [ANME-2 cluster archaeon]MBC2708690.1 hypothetical protein [ANME-2 cluster archaeon]MBC2745396.1 hypothetical protein [ANME-2 cluster archaeon]MBC2762364.1 hypothetical protein [ANME-2 cluster archaeon]